MLDEEIAQSHGTAEERLLLYCKTGDKTEAFKLVKEREEGNLSLDLNTKGNHEWRPLHLACYFGYKEIVELLIKNGAEVDVLNDTGDTPLHKASYTGREELVLFLLSKNADVLIRNGEGLTPREITNNDEIKKLLKAAEDNDLEKRNCILLHASREGDTEAIEKLLRSNNPPFINCVDSLGNTALHCAAYRGKKEVAVLLLQNGIDSSLKNIRGQCAIDLAMNIPMKQLLGVQPVKHFQKTAPRFEGLLLRKSRFLGWKEVWTILEKGVMSFFNSRADSTTGTRRKGYKYLDGAQVLMDDNDTAVFTIVFSDNTRQRFSVAYIDQQQVDRQKWVNSISEHVEFSSYYLKQGFSDSDPEDEDVILPLGTMQDKLQTAQAHLRLFEKNTESLKRMFDELYSCDTASNSTAYNETSFVDLSSHLEGFLESARKVSSSLSHCLTVFSLQEESRLLQLREEQERCRVLQDSLHALAQEHHELEKSFISPFHSPPHSPHYLDTDCDEFFDAFEGECAASQNASHREDTLSAYTAMDSEATACFASFSLSSDETMKSSLPSKWGRSVLPVHQFSRNDFSIWSILKQCIGKELSKITMPVVFNEPVSFLQRLAENAEYLDLVNLANDSRDPVKRLEYVAAFAVACISSNWDRLGKPFNPLLGETFELDREDQGFRIITEQVSHHPPITAFHASSPIFEFSGAIHPKLKLWARSVEVKPEGTVILKLLKHNETYTWKGVTSCIHNIIVGKLWMEQCGVMEIKCHTNGLVAELNFKPAGWYSKDLNCVEGFILDSQKTKLSFLYGKWCSYLKSADVSFYENYLSLKDQLLQNANGRRSTSPLTKNINSSSIDHQKIDSSENGTNVDQKESSEVASTVLWESDPRPEWSSEYYNFTYFAMALNELNDEVKVKLPSTDSRLRPDIRKLEEGDIDGAAFEKNRLEEKQREVRKIRKKEKTSWEPLWFESRSHPYAKEELWFFKGGYWERKFATCPDIF